MRTSLLLWCTNNSAMPPPRQSQSGHHKAIRIVAQLGPGQLWQGLAREQWNPHRSEPNANPNLGLAAGELDRKSTRLNSSHLGISYAVFCLQKKPPLREPTRLVWLDSQESIRAFLLTPA